jgi:hypothetical protein
MEKRLSSEACAHVLTVAAKQHLDHADVLVDQRNRGTVAAPARDELGQLLVAAPRPLLRRTSVLT